MAISPGPTSSSPRPYDERVAYDEYLAMRIRKLIDAAADVREKAMAGWLRVAPEDVRTKRQLARWVTLGTSYARSLPPKR